MYDIFIYKSLVIGTTAELGYDFLRKIDCS